jgi:hypothetical protein
MILRHTEVIAMHRAALSVGFITCLAIAGFSDDVEIRELRDGRMTWTYAGTNAFTAYSVEWAPSMTGAAWRVGWTGLTELVVTTDATVSVEVPFFYRVRAFGWSEITNDTAMVIAYSNAVVDASNAVPAEISFNLTPIVEYNTNLNWRTNSYGARQVLVASFMRYSSATSFYQMGETNITGGDQWVTLCPELRELCHDYRGTDALLRIKQVLGMPPTSLNDTIVEFWVNPDYLFRPAPDPEINDTCAGLVCSTNAPLLSASATISSNYVVWYNDTFNTRNYGMSGGAYNAWPWTRLGYTYDWGQPAGRNFGLSEFVIPNWRAWPGGVKSVPIEVVNITNAVTYGR